MYLNKKIFFAFLFISGSSLILCSLEEPISNNIINDNNNNDNNNNNENMEQQLPTKEQLLNMLDSMNGLSDEEKENLRKDLIRDINGEELPTGKGNLKTQQTLLLFSLLGLLALVFLFFGWKLYKSLTDRERQRMEKKRLKEMKRNKNK